MREVARVGGEREKFLASEGKVVQNEGLHVGGDEAGGDKAEVVFIEEGEGLRTEVVDGSANKTERQEHRLQRCNMIVPFISHARRTPTNHRANLPLILYC